MKKNILKLLVGVVTATLVLGTTKVSASYYYDESKSSWLEPIYVSQELVYNSDGTSYYKNVFFNEFGEKVENETIYIDENGNRWYKPYDGEFGTMSYDSSNPSTVSYILKYKTDKGEQ